MPVLQRKRRAEAETSPSPPPRRRRSGAASEASGSGDDGSVHGDEDKDEENLTVAAHKQMVKKLVRLALATEYSRQPLRRSDITAKVLTASSSRNTFKTVFADAQKSLQNVFGMELTELPLKDKITVAQKRAAHRTGAEANAKVPTSQTYILTSILPAALRAPSILPPGRVPDVSTEASYVGFASFVVGLVYLSEGQRLSEGKLQRYLRAANADDLVLNGERTDNVLKRLERQGYLVKIKERDGAGGEETVEYVVGPRGKVEIGPRGVAGLVRAVYGKRDAELEQLEDRLEASLGVGAFKRKTTKAREGAAAEEEEEGEQGEPAASGPSTARNGQGAPRRSGRQREEATYGRRRTRQSRNQVDGADEDGEEEEEE